MKKLFFILLIFNFILSRAHTVTLKENPNYYCVTKVIYSDGREVYSVLFRGEEKLPKKRILSAGLRGRYILEAGLIDSKGAVLGRDKLSDPDGTFFKRFKGFYDEAVAS